MGMSLAFEGPEGGGKTTSVRILAKVLRENFNLQVMVGREPGGTLPGEDIRTILLNKDYSSKLQANTYVLLYSAARTEFVANMQDWFAENKSGIALTDRCWWSTFALQGSDGATDKYITNVQEPFMDVWPDKVALMCLPPEESIVRLETENRMEGKDRITNWRDSVEIGVFAKIWDRYLNLASKFKDKTILVDGFLSPASICYYITSKGLGLETKPFHEVVDVYQSASESVLRGELLQKLQIESEVRREFGISAKENLREKMHENLIERGLEMSRGGERR